MYKKLQKQVKLISGGSKKINRKYLIEELSELLSYIGSLANLLEVEFVYSLGYNLNELEEVYKWKMGENYLSLYKEG